MGSGIAARQHRPDDPSKLIRHGHNDDIFVSPGIEPIEPRPDGVLYRASSAARLLGRHE